MITLCNNLFIEQIQTGSMMDAFRSSLHLALAISASPGAIIASIILLMTKRAIKNSYSFLLGWFLGLMLIGIIFLHRPGLYNSSGEPSVVLGWIRITLGSAVFITGLYMLKKVIKKEDRGAAPKWADKVDSFGFLQALVVGFFFAVPNVKNASMVTTGAASIGSYGLSGVQETGALILFCLVATIGVMVPPAIFLIFKERSEVIFGKMKVWLIRYRDLILMVICIFFGGLFLYQGIHIVFT